MAFDLNSFMTQGLQYGGARPSKFDVSLTLPTALGMTSAMAAQQKLTFTCKSANIPACSLGEVALPYFGRKIKSAGDRVWSDWRITVMLDEDYITRQMFEFWSNSINAFEHNVMATNIDGEAYKAAWDINHYAKDATYMAQYTLNGAWPRDVGPITLDWEGTDRVSQFDVTVAFDWMNPASNGSTSNTVSNGASQKFAGIGPITYNV
jgi:hypothetical protein